ncbi:MAG: ABC transporter permease [Bacteroidota bacterium]
MFKNHFKIAFRNLVKQKTFSIINIVGLSVGIAGFILVALWVQTELSYDQFHQKVDRIHRVLSNQTYGNNEIMTVGATPGPLSAAAKAEIPEVSSTARTTWRLAKNIKKGATTSQERGYYADPDFLKIFSFPLEKGDPATALVNPDGVIISQKIADQYFSDEVAMGQFLEIGEGTFQVTGILEEIPDNSSIIFDFLLPFQTFEAESDWLQQWGQNGIYTWVLLKEQADLAKVQDKFAAVLSKNNRQENAELFLHAFADAHLYSEFENGKKTGGGRIDDVRLFGFIGLLIILIACINFMNLSTARSRTRAREIGVRKVMGAQRTSLVGQFFAESYLTTFVAILLALFLVDLCLPYFNNLTSKVMTLQLSSPQTWIGLVTLLLLAGFLAGSYPALLLSGFKPIEVLTNRFKGSAKGDFFRKGLVVAQFTIAVFLIIGTGVVLNQLQYMQQKDLGYNKDQLIYLPARTENVQNNYLTIKNELEQLPEILSVSSGSHRLSLIGSSTGSISWEGKDSEVNQMFVSFGTNFDILKTVDAKLVDGRDFSEEFKADSLNFIINESAARTMGMEQPLGQKLSWGEDVGQIVGIVKDFHISPLKYQIDPMVMYIDPRRLNQIYVKVDARDMAQTLGKLENVLAKHNPDQPFEYEFADEEYATFYQAEKQTSELAGIFAALATFICCLGLFGLALFTIEQRTREIGIRKVLGASVGRIVGLLSIDFMKLVGLAILIALPFAYYFSNEWLQDFHYRINTPWMLFLLSGLLAFSIAFFTIGTQSIRAALANPVEALRRE